MHTIRSLRLPAFASALIIATVAAAQTPDTTAKPSGSKPLGFLTDTTPRYGLVPHKFTIGIGGFLPSVSSNGHLSSPTVPGSDIDFEDQLGLKSSIQSIDIEASLRLGKKQLITVGYFGLRRSATKTLQDTLHFGDSTYAAGATVDASTDLQYYGVTYRYYFWRHTAWELGAGLGIDALDLNGSLALRVAVSGGGGGFADSAKKSGGFTVPAPMLGLYGDWEFQPKFFLRGQLQYLYINKVESWGGYLTDDRLAVEWFPLHNYGVGLAYHYVGFRITKDFSNGGALQYTYALQGPALYLMAAF